MNPRQLILLQFWMFMFLNFLSAQQEQSNIYCQAESYYGYSELLVNGPVYMPTFLRAHGTPFFISDQMFRQTLLYIKGESFKNEELQYDIEMDRFCLNKSVGSRQIGTVLLSDDIIDSLWLDDHFFIHSKYLLNNTKSLGFVELVYRGEVCFVIKYSKYLKRNYNDNQIYGKYSNTKMEKYLIADGKVISVNSKNAFLKYFKENKSKLKKFIRKNGIKYAKASPEQLKSILKYCYEE